MELKNAISICLISFFSATLVVLIARTLDVQAAARVEPQLERIALQLEAMRKQGLDVTPPILSDDTLTRDGLVAYYFHGKVRCDTCRKIESLTLATLESDYRQQLDNGQIAWKVCNYEADSPQTAQLVKQFEIQMSNVVLARVAGGRIERWKRLDQVWSLFDDEPAFAAFIRGEVDGMLKP